MKVSVTRDDGLAHDTANTSCSFIPIRARPLNITSAEFAEPDAVGIPLPDLHVPTRPGLSARFIKASHIRMSSAQANFQFTFNAETLRERSQARKTLACSSCQSRTEVLTGSQQSPWLHLRQTSRLREFGTSFSSGRPTLDWAGHP